VAGLLIVLTIGLPWVGALSVLVAGDRRPRAQHGLAVGFAVAAAVTAMALLWFSTAAVALRLSAGGIFGDFTFVPDGFGVFLAAVATVVGSLAVIFSVEYMRGQAQLGRYYALVLMFIGAMAGLVLTGSLLLLFLFWEMVAFCSYALIAFHNDDPKAVAGGIKALIMTQAGGIGLLAGVLLIYAHAGTMEIGTFLARADAMPPAALSMVAFGFLMAAAAKSAQVPFHTWLPDAMEAPTPVSALIHAATMVNAGVYLLARFSPAFARVPGWPSAVVLVGVASALVAALLALAATDLKRLLAYSTISQLGYMVYAVGAGAVFASQFHLLSHAVYKALLFLGAGAVIHAIGTRDLRQMGGLSAQMPFVRAVFVLGAAALAGMPILNGFWSKELVLGAGAADGWRLLSSIMLVVTGLTACYALRAVTLVFYGQARGVKGAHDAPMAMRIALAALAAGTVSSWLLGGALGRVMARTLPFHQLDAQSLWEIVMHVVTAPQTVVMLTVTALGLLAWWRREHLPRADRWLRGASWMLERDFGFEWINTRVVKATRGAASVASLTQTGQLNWNMAGIVAGLLGLLTIAAVGALR
jgi:NADH-quinone oxidoreductase subunit L